MNAADTSWMLISTALVLLMTPALAFFYGGLVRSKNSLNTMMMSYISFGFVGVLWAVLGYSLAFATGNDYVGDLSRLFLKGVGLEPQGTIPHYLFMCYQGTFAIITAALISGAIVERMQFSAYITFISLWCIVVYAPVAHWVWGGGWLAKMGALDFAGGTVVHVNAGVAALVAALCVGPRRDYKKAPLLPHNVPFTLLGAGLLWFGWFGFNAGSALAASSLATSAFVATHFASAAGAVSWMIAERVRNGKASALGGISGAVAGLATVTQGAGFVEPFSAVLIGLIAGFVCFAMVIIVKIKLGYDDSLDAFGVHGIGGLMGCLLTGIFATNQINNALKLPNGSPAPLGWVDGNAGQVLNQGIGAVIGIAFGGGFTWGSALLRY